MEGSVVAARGAEVRYSRGGFTLGPVSLELSAGVLALVGPNGAGKSTLIRLFAKLQKPTSGEVVFIGSGLRRDRTGHIGYLDQHFVAPSRAKCDDFLHYVAWLQGVPRAGRDAAVREALSGVGLLDRASEKIGSLSGGMKRRLGIAQAIVHHPSIVLLDEPTAGLDLDQRLGLCEVIRRAAPDVAVVVSTHILDDVPRMADRLAILQHGEITYHGHWEDAIEAAERRGKSANQTDVRALHAIETLLQSPDDIS